MEEVMSAVSISSRLVRCSAYVVITHAFCNLILAHDALAAGLYAPIEPPVAQYDIKCTVEFDSTEARVFGTGIVSLTNASPLPMERLALEWTVDSLHELSVEVNGETAAVISHGSGDDSYAPAEVQLPQALGPGHGLEIRTQFERLYIFEAGDDKHLWTDWFPRISWGMHTQDNYTLEVAYPSEYVLASSGLYNPETDTYQADGVRRYGLWFFKDADVLKKESDGIAIRVIHTPAAAECANLVMETAVDAAAYYKRRFGF
jgi:hypothetical protein